MSGFYIVHGHHYIFTIVSKISFNETFRDQTTVTLIWARFGGDSSNCPRIEMEN